MQKNSVVMSHVVGGLEEDAEIEHQEALLKASAFQSAIFNSANFSSITTDAKGVIQIFNVGAERMLGYTAADVVNKVKLADLADPQELIARAEALSKELGTPITPGFEALVFKASRGIEDIYELTYIRRDRSRFPVVVSVTALRAAQNTIIGYQLIGTDITERKRAEAALRDSRDQLEQRVQARTADLQTANLTLLAEKARQEMLIRKLEEAQNQLLQSEKMASIGQLAAGVAHEINNPVGFVNSNLGALQRYAEDMLKLLAAYEQIEPALAPEVLQNIKQLKKEIDIAFLRDDIGNLLTESLDGLQRVKRIVQDLKDFSHVDESERQWADLETGLESTLRVVWNELKYKAEVVKEYGAIPQIECFPSQLNRVFMNLLVNASHAIEEHGRITIRTGQDGENVWVEVEDSGKGIQPEHLGRIFEPFFTTKPVGKGTGLGLSLSYGIVQKHGGRIEVKSEPGKGSVFKMVLPQRAGPDDNVQV